MISACACGGPLTVWLDWPQVPLANALRASAASPPAPRHDLTLGRCHACGTTALLTPAPPTTVFQRGIYPYRSGAVAPCQVHAAALAAKVHAAAPPGSVYDVGGNDGTLRDRLRAVGRHAWVIDPCTDEADIAGFFPEVTQAVPAGSVAAITALNVFAHVPDPQAFADEVARLLMPDGVFVLEVLWIGDVLAQGALDTLYHEHWWHWSATGLINVLLHAGLRVTEIEHLPVQGGSLRVWAQKTRHIGSSGTSLDEAHLLEAAPYRMAHAAWDARLAALRAHLASGRRWAGYAATAKATMLAYATPFGPKEIAYVIDATPEKQGQLTPYDVPIVPMTRLAEDPVDGVLLFSASYAPELRRNLLAAGFTGAVVVA